MAFFTHWPLSQSGPFVSTANNVELPRSNLRVRLRTANRSTFEHERLESCPSHSATDPQIGDDNWRNDKSKELRRRGVLRDSREVSIDGRRTTRYVQAKQSIAGSCQCTRARYDRTKRNARTERGSGIVVACYTSTWCLLSAGCYLAVERVAARSESPPPDGE